MVWISDCIVYMYVQEQYTWYICIYMYAPVYVGAYMDIVRVYTINLSHMCSQTLLNSVCWIDISRSLCIYI